MTTGLIFYLLITSASGVGLWLKGYKNTDYKPSRNSAPGFIRVLVKPPYLFYLLCGFPESAKYPKGVMTAWAFSMQFLGVGMLVYTFLSISFKPNIFGMFLILVATLFFTYGMTYWLSKYKVYKLS